MKLSILDLAHVPVGSDAGTALRNALDYARHADALGYERLWYAEHHNMPGIASAATSIVIGQAAGATSRIRVGAGGIMLPNHSPLVIAEQFGTLESLFPGRIDLGLGRAPGTDGLTWRALRRDPGASDRFPEDVLELQALLGPVQRVVKRNDCVQLPKEKKIPTANSAQTYRNAAAMKPANKTRCLRGMRLATNTNRLPEPKSSKPITTKSRESQLTSLLNCIPTKGIISKIQVASAIHPKTEFR